MIQNVGRIDFDRNRFGFGKSEVLVDAAIDPPAGNRSHRVVSEISLMTRQRILQQRNYKQPRRIRRHRSRRACGNNLTKISLEPFLVRI